MYKGEVWVCVCVCVCECACVCVRVCACVVMLDTWLHTHLLAEPARDTSYRDAWAAQVLLAHHEALVVRLFVPQAAGAAFDLHIGIFKGVRKMHCCG